MFIKSPIRIKIENFSNKCLNFVVNNSFSNYLKEIDMNLFGSGCFEFLYCDSSEEFIAAFSKKKLDRKQTEVIVTACDKVAGAKNFGNLNWFQKRSLLRDVNRFFEPSTLFDGKVFRWRKILTISSLQ